MNCAVRRLLLAIAVSSMAAHADDRAELDQKLKTEYRGKVLILRHFYSGDNLRYDNRGELRMGGPPGPWTLWGKVRITNVKLTRDSVVLEGDRSFLVYDEGRKEFRDLFDLDSNADDVSHWFAHPDRFRDQVKQLAQDRGVRIEIDVKGLNESESLAALSNVFLPEEELAQEVPAFWRDVASAWSPAAAARTSDAESEGGEAIYKVGGGVSAPRGKHAPDPEYSESARAAGVRAKLGLTIVVTPSGRVTDVRIAKPAGMGLDERAVEAVSSWEFEPAKKDGRPVAVRVTVECTFELY